MSAPNSEEEETRVILGPEGARLVLLAQEAFSTATEKFQENLSKQIPEWERRYNTSFRLESNKESENGNLVEIVPAELKAQGEAVLVRAAIFVHPDQTIQRVFVYVTPVLARNPQKCIKMAANILATLTPGSGHLNTSPRTCTLDAYSQTKMLSASLPQIFIVTTRNGPDFLVHSIKKVVPFGTRPTTIGIYLGGHPDSGRLEEMSQAPNTVRETGILLGGKVEWVLFEHPDGSSGRSTLHMECITSASELSPKLYIHVFLEAAKKQQLEELRGIADTLRIVGK